MAVVSKRELHLLNDMILAIDPTAFIISNATHSVRGVVSRCHQLIYKKRNHKISFFVCTFCDQSFLFFQDLFKSTKKFNMTAVRTIAAFQFIISFFEIIIFNNKF